MKPVNMGCLGFGESFHGYSRTSIEEANKTHFAFDLPSGKLT